MQSKRTVSRYNGTTEAKADTSGELKDMRERSVWAPVEKDKGRER
jgi:hypothetical protein